MRCLRICSHLHLSHYMLQLPSLHSTSVLLNYFLDLYPFLPFLCLSTPTLTGLANFIYFQIFSENWSPPGSLPWPLHSVFCVPLISQSTLYFPITVVTTLYYDYHLFVSLLLHRALTPVRSQYILFAIVGVEPTRLAHIRYPINISWMNYWIFKINFSN